MTIQSWPAYAERSVQIPRDATAIRQITSTVDRDKALVDIIRSPQRSPDAITVFEACVQRIELAILTRNLSYARSGYDECEHKGYWDAIPDSNYLSGRIANIRRILGTPPPAVSHRDYGEKSEKKPGP